MLRHSVKLFRDWSLSNHQDPWGSGPWRITGDEWVAQVCQCWLGTDQSWPGRYHYAPWYKFKTSIGKVYNNIWYHTRYCISISYLLNILVFSFDNSSDGFGGSLIPDKPHSIANLGGAMRRYYQNGLTRHSRSGGSNVTQIPFNWFGSVAIGREQIVESALVSTYVIKFLIILKWNTEVYQICWQRIVILENPTFEIQDSLH